MQGESCEFPLANASDEEMKALLSATRTVAVVGLSTSPEKDSHRVAAYLQQQGYRIIPVNPNAQKILGERAYPSLDQVPPELQVDVVDIFRPPEFIPAIVEQAIARGVKGVWMQKGLAHNAAANRARAAGIVVVMDRCMMVEHRRLLSPRA
ncbi:MAG: CoA-binding protein [Thermoanaerobaculum sp.]|nr:CoA-binding protein [Thermoanaerobaculum sp.]MDW7967381.1 CoA-binding protein [Thermoanaerobaculum sp.]